MYEYPGGSYRRRTGAVHIPVGLEKIIRAVLGLDNRPQARAHCRVLDPSIRPAMAAPSISYTPPQVAELYNFPSGFNGRGETIGVIELGGGYKQSDLDVYFSSLGI
jgi:kumamolisin